MKFVRIGLLSILFILPTGCGMRKPDAMRVFESPRGDYSVVVEKFVGTGTLSSDYAEVYAVRKIGDKSVKELILDGELDVSKIIWTGDRDIQICISPYSITSRFRNVVSLIHGSTQINVHSKIKEGCA